MSGPWIKVNWMWSSRRWQEWTSIILAISELKWTGIREFNSDDHYIYYCGLEQLTRNGVALIVNKRACNSWVQPQKWQNDLGSFPRQTIQHHSNPRPCPNHWCRRSWSWLALWRPTTPSRTNTIFMVLVLFIFILGNCKSRNQVIPGITGKFGQSTKWSRVKDNRVLSREYAGGNKHSFPTTQEKTVHMDITRWSILKSDWLCSL